MRGLTAIVAGRDPERAAAALATAAAMAALGGRARVYLHAAAVALLCDPATEPHLAAARETGVTIVACQTGLADVGLSADTFGVEGGGLVSLLATLGDDRLVTF